MMMMILGTAWTWTTYYFLLQHASDWLLPSTD